MNEGHGRTCVCYFYTLAARRCAGTSPPFVKCILHSTVVCMDHSYPIQPLHARYVYSWTCCSICYSAAFSTQDVSATRHTFRESFASLSNLQIAKLFNISFRFQIRSHYCSSVSATTSRPSESIATATEPGSEILALHLHYCVLQLSCIPQERFQG